MADVIVFNGDSGVAVTYPAPSTGLTIDEVAKLSTPEGVKYMIVNSETLPQTYPQATWKINFESGEVQPDMDKVSAIYQSEAGAKRDQLIDEANIFITSNNWPTKLALGRLKDADKEKLNAWLDYIDVLEDTDLSDAPDVKWPVKPE